MSIKNHIKNYFYGMMCSMSYLSCLLILNNVDKVPFNHVKNSNRILTNVLYIYLFFARLYFCLLDSSLPFTLKNFVKVYEGGLSSFGGQFSVIIYILYVSYSYNIKLLYILDTAAMLVPVVGIFIRLGNYVNNRIKSRYNTYLHVSLIEMFLHGIVLGIIILYNYIYYYKPGSMFNIYIKYYITIRFFTEFVRKNKKYYNLEYNGINIGIHQICCLITINPYFLLFIIDQYSKQYYKLNRSNSKYNNQLVRYTLITLCMIYLFLCTILYKIFKFNNLCLIGTYGIIIDYTIFENTRYNTKINNKPINLNYIFLCVGLLLYLFNYNLNYTFYYQYI